jgi:hypothetical protein
MIMPTGDTGDPWREGASDPGDDSGIAAICPLCGGSGISSRGVCPACDGLGKRPSPPEATADPASVNQPRAPAADQSPDRSGEPFKRAVDRSRSGKSLWPVALAAVALVIIAWMLINAWGADNPRRTNDSESAVVEPSSVPPTTSEPAPPVEGVGDASRGQSSVRGDGDELHQSSS